MQLGNLRNLGDFHEEMEMSEGSNVQQELEKVVYNLVLLRIDGRNWW
jgi:hypothetical protein